MCTFAPPNVCSIDKQTCILEIAKFSRSTFILTIRKLFQGPLVNRTIICELCFSRKSRHRLAFGSRMSFDGVKVTQTEAQPNSKSIRISRINLSLETQTSWISRTLDHTVKHHFIWWPSLVYWLNSVCDGQAHDCINEFRRIDFASEIHSTISLRSNWKKNVCRNSTEFRLSFKLNHFSSDRVHWMTSWKLTKSHPINWMKLQPTNSQ